MKVVFKDTLSGKKVYFENLEFSIRYEDCLECRLLNSKCIHSTETGSIIVKKNKIKIYFDDITTEYFSPCVGYRYSMNNFRSKKYKRMRIIEFQSLDDLLRFAKGMNTSFPRFENSSKALEILKILSSEGISFGGYKYSPKIGKNVYLYFLGSGEYNFARGNGNKIVTSNESLLDNLKILREELREDYSSIEKKKILCFEESPSKLLKFIRKILFSKIK